MKKLKINKRNILLIFILLIVLSSLALLSFTKSAAIKDLENDVEVKVNSELAYYLNVSYDGVDRNSYDSRIPEEGVRSKLYSGYIYVEDKLPEGLTFQNFVTSGNGSVGAVNPITGRSCLGEVFNDTEDSEQSDSNYYGLHYDETTHTVHFRVKGLEAGCVLTVGIVTKTPETVDDPDTELVEERRDFYNFATAREENLTKYSNTVHVFIQEGEEEIELHTVTYKYEEGTPSNAPTLPEETSYAKNTSVGIASEPYLEGYKFNGWKVESDSGTVVPATNTMFIMPDENVTLVGSFTKLDSYEVSYSIEGEIPDGFVVPSTKEYYPNQDVIVGMYAGDEYNGYRFSGWKTSDVEQNKNGDFVMPENDVHLVGSFELVTYTVTYEFTGETLPPNSSKYLPPSQSYPVCATVKLPVVQDAPGYHFRGWEEGDNFPMPAEDIVVTGEWDIQRGTFSPTIKKEIVNPQEVYKVGDIVEFKITVTNTAGYAITNVNVSENNENARFIKNVGYSLRTDRLVLIDYMDPYSSTVINAEYEVTEKDNGVIINEVEILGADSTNYYDLDLTKEYKASASFKVLSKLNVCKTVTNVDDKDLFQFHISGNNYDTWLNISSNECKEIYIASGDYQIIEIIPQSYELTDITYSSNLNGNQTNNTLNFTIGTESGYEIAFVNRYLTKDYLHQSGREENIIEGNSISKEDMETLDWSKIGYIKAVWDDEGNENKRPDSITVELYQDGQVVKQDVLNLNNEWTLDLYANGWNELIRINPNSTWGVSEEDLLDYASKFTLENETLIFNNTFSETLRQPLLTETIKAQAFLDNEASTYVTTSTGINLADISSDTNGRGVYILYSTTGTENPIMYYRGEVDNNNVLFAGFCWQIIRTTETGGIKLIYNGIPNNGVCDNTGENSQIDTSTFNSASNSIAYLGYMYGTVYTNTSRTKPTTSYYYGKLATYSSSKYTLSTYSKLTMSTSTTIYPYHFTCFSTAYSSCTSAYYIYYMNSTTAYYFPLSGVTTLSSITTAMKNNTNESVIKGVVDEWYEDNLSGTLYEEFLEDTVFCNNRTAVSGALYSTTAYNNLTNNFGTFAATTPSLACSNSLDKFTTETVNGNGKLTYPVGLITSDEVRFAGGSKSYNNTNNFLNTGSVYWTMSPSSVTSTVNIAAVDNNGKLAEYIPSTSSIGVRPVISLKSDSIVLRGNGTKDSPYVIKTGS